MRLAELLEGEKFQTRLTHRLGVVEAHTDRGVAVRWLNREGMADLGQYLHPEIVVDVIAPSNPA